MVSNYWTQDSRLKNITLSAEEHNFFQLVRLLEGLPKKDGEELPINFSGHNSPALKPNFVDGIELSERSGVTSVTVSANAFHLLGQQGPIPQVFSEQIARESQSGNTGAAAFLDIFNDKILRTLFEVKKKFSPLLFNGEASEAQLFALFEAVSGVADGSAFERKIPSGFPRFWRSCANVFGNRRVGYGLLKQLLTKLLSMQVDVEPATGGWRSLPSASQVKLDGSVALDGSRSLGCRYWSHANCITITLTSQTLREYESSLPGAAEHDQVVALIAILSDLLFDVTLELELDVKETVYKKLGDQVRLGFTSWLGGNRQRKVAPCGARVHLGREQMLGALNGSDT